MSDINTGFILDRAYCQQCDFSISPKAFPGLYNGELTEPQPLKENIINRVRREHNRNCEPGMVIIIDNCYYEQQRKT